MAPRDTIIEVHDARLGYRARINVPYSKVVIALRTDRRPNGQPTELVDKARKLICMQAKAEMRKAGRPNHVFLAWEDIVRSVEQSEKVPARGTDPEAPVAKAYAATQPRTPAPQRTQDTLF